MADEALLVVLLIGWAAVLLPSALKSRSRSLHATVGGFEHAMAVLRNRPDGREIMVPRDPDRIVRGAGTAAPRRPHPGAGRAGDDPVVARRRALFQRLLGATGLSFVFALLFGGVLWPLFLATAGVTGGYVALLRHYKIERDRARDVVRSIDLTAFERHDEAEQERVPVAVGQDRYSGLQVATRPDDPWEPHSGVRIRRWGP